MQKIKRRIAGMTAVLMCAMNILQPVTLYASAEELPPETVTETETAELQETSTVMETEPESPIETEAVTATETEMLSEMESGNTEVETETGSETEETEPEPVKYIVSGIYHGLGKVTIKDSIGNIYEISGPDRETSFEVDEGVELTMQAALHGWSSYGDTEYPGHVLRYYSSGSTTSFGLIGANGWCWPSDTALLTDTFGYQDWRGGNHNGIDIGASYGSSIYAASGGTVWIAGYSNSAGNWVVIEHGNGIKTVYMHASELYVSAGQTVSAGQPIAAVGSTGWSTGPHLHFGVMINSSYNGYDGIWVDPLQYVRAD